jgi:hypothetical protein
MFSYSESLPIIDVASESYHNVTLLRDFDKFPPRQYITPYDGKFLCGETFSSIDISYDYAGHIMYTFYIDDKEITTVVLVDPYSSEEE